MIFRTFFILVIAASPLWLPAAAVETATEPATDGILIDANGDGIADRAISTTADGNEVREALNGKIWKQTRKAVFEFRLPELAAPVSKATLKLSLNGKFGCYPEQEGAFGPASDLYFYLAPEADGKIELTDDNGTKLGQAIGAAPRQTDTKPIKPVTIDVTRAVEAARQAKSTWVGFRIEASEDAPEGCGWRWRTSEFAAISGKQYNPVLIIVTQ